jgi:hypothetical protein
MRYYGEDLAKTEKSVTRMWTVLVLALFSIATMIVTYFIVERQGSITGNEISVVDKKVDSVIEKLPGIENSLSQIQIKQQQTEDKFTDSVVLIFKKLNLTLMNTNLNRKLMDSIRVEIASLEILLDKNDSIQR